MVSHITPMATPDKVPSLITMALYSFHILFLPFDIIIGDFILAAGIRLLGDSFYFGGILSLLIYFLYFLMQFVYSFLLSSALFVSISHFQRK